MESKHLDFTVSVRVRPFLHFESYSDDDKVSCIEKESNLLVFKNPKTAEVIKTQADHVFWSTDGYSSDENGKFVPANDVYSDQEKIYADIGKPLTDNLFEGRNSFLFNFGSTAVGKRYTFFGDEKNPGLAPQAFEDIFKRIEQNQDESVTYEVIFSMLEIYCEKVRDILQKNKNDLKIREGKEQGIYVEGMSEVTVKNFQEIFDLMNTGLKNITSSQASLNANAGRGHIFMKLELVRKKIEGDQTTSRISNIKILRVAGNEKISKTGVSSDVLKEVVAIHKGINCMRRVIENLADQSKGKAASNSVFRESVMTRLVQDCFKKDVKISMLCCISPSAKQAEEILNTLKIVDSAYKIMHSN